MEFLFNNRSKLPMKYHGRLRIKQYRNLAGALSKRALWGVNVMALNLTAPCPDSSTLTSNNA